MPSTPCAIVVDPEGLTVTVDITRHIGAATSTPTTYTAEHGSTARTLPLSISSETEFWLTEPGDYTVSVFYNGNEIAGGAPAPGESGQAVRREVGHGQRWRIVPSVDTEELRADSGASRPVLLTAGAMSPLQGSPTLSGTGGPRFSAWLLDAASSETVSGNVWVPDDWTTFSVDLWWTNAGAGAGDVVFNAAYAPTADGDDQAAGDTLKGQTTLVAPAQGVTRVSSFWASITRSGNFYHFRVDRLGAVAADTLANDVGVLGLVLAKVS